MSNYLFTKKDILVPVIPEEIADIGDIKKVLWEFQQTIEELLVSGINTDTILLSAFDASLDDIADGTYGKVLSTAISAGKIVLTGNGVTGSLSVTYTDADVTGDQSQDLDWVDGTSGTLTLSSTGKLAINVADALEITANGSVLIKQGGNLRLDGGDLYLDTLFDNPDYYYPEIFWRDHSDNVGCVMTLAASLYKAYPNIKIDGNTYTKDIILVADKFDLYAAAGGRMYLGSGTFLISGVANVAITLDQSANDRITLAGNVVISTGLHVGGTGNAGANNLIVDGTATITALVLNAQNVTAGANDSGGGGFRLLRVPNV